MLKFVLASRNRKKIRELETFLSAISSDIQILSLDDIGYTDEIVEDGATYTIEKDDMKLGEVTTI